MQDNDTFASLIAFLFEQDRKEHLPPRDQIATILKNKTRPQAEHKENEKWHKS